MNRRILSIGLTAGIPLTAFILSAALALVLQNAGGELLKLLKSQSTAGPVESDQLSDENKQGIDAWIQEKPNMVSVLEGTNVVRVDINWWRAAYSTDARKRWAVRMFSYYMLKHTKSPEVRVLNELDNAELARMDKAGQITIAPQPEFDATGVLPGSP